MRIYKYISMYKLGLRITAIATAETATREFEEGAVTVFEEIRVGGRGRGGSFHGRGGLSEKP